MKMKYLMIVCLMLTIITIGAVSASEDADALAVENSTDTIDSVDDEKTIDSSQEDSSVLSDDEDDYYWEYHNPLIKPDGYVEYDSDKNITFEIPSDAEGTLKVYEYDYDDEYNIIGFKFNKTINVVNGVGNIPLKELSIGSHTLMFEYTGDYENQVRSSFSEWYYDDGMQVMIYPFIIQEKVWTGEDLIAKFVWPFEMVANVTVYDNERYSGNLISNGSTKDGQINLGKFNEGYHELYFYFENETGNVFGYDEYSFFVSIDAISQKPDWEIEVIDSEVVNVADQRITLVGIGAKTGEFKLYIDGKQVDIFMLSDYIEFDASDLSLGNHTFNITYSGDDYFKPASKAGQLKVTNVKIVIPESYDMMMDDDSITITLSKDATGRVIVKANGTEIYNEVFDNEGLDDYVYLVVDLIELNSGINDIVVTITGKYPVIKTGKINATYHLNFNSDVITYGEDMVELDVPYGISGDVYVKIDGKEYKALKTVDAYGTPAYFFEVPANITLGTHEAVIRYSGDEKFAAQEFKDNLTVEARIIVPYEIDDESEIYLILPEDAVGNLTLKLYKFINGNATIIKDLNITLVNGKASLPLNDLGYANYFVEIQYTGDDYYVPEVSESFAINPDIIAPSKMIEGGKEVISINVPGWNGTFTISFSFNEFDDYEKVLSVDLKDGKASISLSDLSEGFNSVSWVLMHTYMMENWDGEYYPDEEYFSGYVYIDVQKPVIKASNANTIYTDGSLYKIQITGIDKDLIVVGDTVTFKIANKVIGTGKLDKNGFASVKIKQIPGSYKITIQYKKTSVTKKLTVKHVLKLQKVKVKRSAKKLVIKATLAKVNGKYLKGKKITLKFNGKKYAAKTNKKGVAKFTIKKNVLKKLKKGKKVKYQATYLKDTIKYTVKVKK